MARSCAAGLVHPAGVYRYPRPIHSARRVRRLRRADHGLAAGGKPVALVWLLLAFALAEAVCDLLAWRKRRRACASGASPPRRSTRWSWPPCSPAAAGAAADGGPGAADAAAGGADGAAAVPPVLSADRGRLHAGAADRLDRRAPGAGRAGSAGLRRRRRAHRAVQRRRADAGTGQRQQPGAVGGGGVGAADRRAVPVLRAFHVRQGPARRPSTGWARA